MWALPLPSEQLFNGSTMSSLFHFLPQAAHPGSTEDFPPLTSGMCWGMAVAWIVIQTGLQLLCLCHWGMCTLASCHFSDAKQPFQSFNRFLGEEEVEAEVSLFPCVPVSERLASGTEPTIQSDGIVFC